MDVKSKRLFLKKTSCPETLSKKDFFLNNKILLYGRTYEILAYGDGYTKGACTTACQSSVALVLEISVMGNIIDALIRNGLTIAALKMVTMSDEMAREYYAELDGTTYVDNWIAPLVGTRVLAIQAVGENSIEKLKALVGPLCARYGSQWHHNNVPMLQVAETDLQAQSQEKVLFTGKNSTATFDNCTCCVIQPHILKEGKMGLVIESILKMGHDITALQLFNLDRASAAEFMEVYEGVVPHFNDAIDQLITGPCVAMEVVSYREDVNAVTHLRQSAGPWDVEMAKELRPGSIRAQFGQDRVKNGIHCTDLPEDGILESQYFFDILARR